MYITHVGLLWKKRRFRLNNVLYNMKIWQSEHIFNHPWDTVVQAAWRKYPNPMNPSVVGLDVVDRRLDKNGVLHSHRLMATEWGLPKWVTGIVGLNQVCYVSEHSEVNPEKKVMSLRSRNLTFANFVSIDEHLVYKPNPTDPNSTLLEQEATISVQGVPLTDYLENLVLGTCSGNAHKGRQAMEWVINKIKIEAQDFQRVAQEGMEKIKSEAQDIQRAAQQSIDNLTNVGNL